MRNVAKIKFQHQKLAHQYPPPPLPHRTKELWVSGRFGLCIKSWDFGFQADLDSASKVGTLIPLPSPLDIGTLGFRQIWTLHQKLRHYLSPSPQHREFGFQADLDSGERWIQPAETYLTVAVNFIVFFF